MTQMVAQPTMTYAAPPQQDVQYVNEFGQPCTADGQLLLPQQDVQYVNEYGQPCTADGQVLMPMQYSAPAPATFNITPEQFAILAQGGSISQAGLDALLDPAAT